jgi:hypothetical protein
LISRLVLAGGADRQEIIVGGDALDERREHVVGHIADEADVVVLQYAEEGIGPGHCDLTGVDTAA